MGTGTAWGLLCGERERRFCGVDGHFWDDAGLADACGLCRGHSLSLARNSSRMQQRVLGRDGRPGKFSRGPTGEGAVSSSHAGSGVFSWGVAE
jgi:hypothetical protein